MKHRPASIPGYLVAGERHASGSGHRVRIEAICGGEHDVVRVSTGSGVGYAFAGRAAVHAIADYAILKGMPELTDLQISYASGRPNRPELRREFLDHMLPLVLGFVRSHPEIFEVPSITVRRLASPEVASLLIQTGIGTLTVSTHPEHGVVVEKLALSGGVDARNPKREMLATFGPDGSSRLWIWTTDVTGVRRLVRPDDDEVSVFELIGSRLETVHAPVAEDLEAILAAEAGRIPRISIQRKAHQLPGTLRTRFGTKTTLDLIEDYNAARASRGRPPLRSDDFPSSQETLDAFLHLYQTEFGDIAR